MNETFQFFFSFLSKFNGFGSILSALSDKLDTAFFYELSRSIVIILLKLGRVVLLTSLHSLSERSESSLLEESFSDFLCQAWT